MPNSHICAAWITPPSGKVMGTLYVNVLVFLYFYFLIIKWAVAVESSTSYYLASLMGINVDIHILVHVLCLHEGVELLEVL